jgi:O-acetyl-ADP-ribose deacetylase (regulator of RNase III)
MKGIEIHTGDITRLEVDAIVNAANEQLAPGGGVCGAIHRAAGPELARECRQVGPCPTGDARITRGYDLSAKWVIHAVGPVWHGGGSGEDEALEGAYRASMRLAAEKGLGSIAFPAISTGIFGFPLERATAIAVRTVKDEMTKPGTPRHVVFCCFGKDVEAAYERTLAS